MNDRPPGPTADQALDGAAAQVGAEDESGSAPLRLSMVSCSTCKNPRLSASPKQVAVPVWHTGPDGTARTNKVSPSQSTATERKAKKLPEVSPFVHNRPFERLKKVTFPVSRLTARASSFM